MRSGVKYPRFEHRYLDPIMATYFDQINNSVLTIPLEIQPFQIRRIKATTAKPTPSPPSRKTGTPCLGLRLAQQ